MPFLIRLHFCLSLSLSLSLHDGRAGCIRVGVVCSTNFYHFSALEKPLERRCGILFTIIVVVPPGTFVTSSVDSCIVDIHVYNPLQPSIQKTLLPSRHTRLLWCRVPSIKFFSSSSFLFFDKFVRVVRVYVHLHIETTRPPSSLVRPRKFKILSGANASRSPVPSKNVSIPEYSRN